MVVFVIFKQQVLLSGLFLFFFFLIGSLDITRKEQKNTVIFNGNKGDDLYSKE